VCRNQVQPSDSLATGCTCCLGDYGGDGYEDDGTDGFAAGTDLLGGASLLEAEAGGLRPWAAMAGAGRADGLPDWMGGGGDSSGEQSYEELCR
jgi:hypothetical protein